MNMGPALNKTNEQNDAFTHHVCSRLIANSMSWTLSTSVGSESRVPPVSTLRECLPYAYLVPGTSGSIQAGGKGWMKLIN